ncbi:SET domain-containing protein 3 [Fusarium equiseti]|uniref:SET domain-containing protein 3 n=1 Tax=Fusarium equiseti TaxID=61235 RepID=A0ABQ8RCT5_FUSEQ|nr:SET domain-containing protein 3 [Fusarium equiseti]
MTEKPVSLSTQSAAPSQIAPVQSGAIPKDEAARPADGAEEEPYTIKCICNFSDDDGNTIYCETCDTWQHIDCFYPDNRDEAIREDFAHSCAECKPRPLDRQKAIERTLRLKNGTAGDERTDKRTKRPPSKSHKKRSKPADLLMNGHASPQENGRHNHAGDQQPPPKKAKHRSSQSVSSQAPKRSPSYGNGRSNTAHPPSPATTPPDLPEDFQIHQYSQGFYNLYNARDVPDSHNNAFASLAIPTALSRWLRDPNTMRSEVGRRHSEVFQKTPTNLEVNKPKLEVGDTTRTLDDGKALRWRFLKSSTPIEKDVPLVELNGAIGFQKDYCTDPANLWADLSSPLPFVFFHPVLPLYIDTRQEGSLARYVRRSCKPNAQLDTYLSDESEYHFWIVSDRYISANEQITLPWDFRLEKSVHARWLNLLGLSDDDSSSNAETPVDETEYMAISNWMNRILSEYGGCACDLDNNCAFARFHRQYLHGKPQVRGPAKKKPRKSKTQAISPTSTGQTITSRATSEGHIEDSADHDNRSQSGSLRSKPPSRDLTPLRQGSFDQLGILTEPTDRDKRKVAMVEDTFRRMEQQQPPRKKKRVSDGTGSASSKSKHRNGSVASHGNYVDAGTCRSHSGSPTSTSPHIHQGPSIPDQSLAASRSRESSIAPRGVYCDVAVQTDPVEGAWFSEHNRSPRPKKRIIPLSKRLLNSRHKVKTEEDDLRRRSSVSQASNGTAMEVDSPVEHAPSIKRSESELPPLFPTSGDVPLADASSPATTPVLGSAASDTSARTKTPDFRLQLPPVPSFDSTGLGIHSSTTPQPGVVAHSPLSGPLPSPFAPPAVNGVAAHPSPVKKKLSLSDYTKSRMNKTAGKTAGGHAVLKPSISSPEDTRVDIMVDSHSIEKPPEGMVMAPVAATNGSL